MPQIMIVVEFETLEGAGPEFARIIAEHARRTLQEEPGCLRFEVVKPLDEDWAPVPNRLVVNELYVDQAAVAAHRATPRMAALGELIGPLVKSRRRILGRAVSEQPDDEGRKPQDLNAANDD